MFVPGTILFVFIFVSSEEYKIYCSVLADRRVLTASYTVCTAAVHVC